MLYSCLRYYLCMRFICYVFFATFYVYFMTEIKQTNKQKTKSAIKRKIISKQALVSDISDDCVCVSDLGGEENSLNVGGRAW